MYTSEALTDLLHRFIAIISPEIHIKGLYLFGSYANGTPHQYSDIDVAIVSDDFRGIRFYDKQRLHKLLIDKTYPDYVFVDVQLHPFKTEDFSSSNPLAEEIIQTGKKII